MDEGISIFEWVKTAGSVVTLVTLPLVVLPLLAFESLVAFADNYNGMKGGGGCLYQMFNPFSHL